MTAWRLACVLALSLLWPAITSAQVPVRAPERAGEAGARQHFDRALELYRSGQYARARDELQSAAALDPGGKDLFFNLALVQEKLGALDEAIAALEKFRELESDAAERQRAQLTIERLRGAKQEGVSPPPAVATAAAPCSPTAQAEPPESGPSPVLIGAAATSVVALVVGTVFGVKALSDDVADERTSTSFSVAQLRERARRAEQEALVADIAFAVAAASATTFVCVWLLTPREASARGAGVSWVGRF